MEFWNSTLTEKSWQIMLQLKEKNFGFIVIGGWAAYLWTHLHKSKDIDIALKNFDDLVFLKKNYNLIKNNNLKKYEIKIEEIDIDIYVPFFSKLAIPIDEIKKYTTIIQNFEVVKPEVLLILKQGAEYDRERSVKGQKDRIDIMTLLCYEDMNFSQYFKLLKEYNLEKFYDRLKKIIISFKELKYIDMTPRQFKLRKNEILDMLRKIT